MKNNSQNVYFPTRRIRFSGISARIHYYLLMALYQLAFTRGAYGHFARGLARFFPQSNAVWLHLDDGPGFQITLDDAYWTRFALYHFPYEPEIDTVLRACVGKTSLFCDLGANKGFWTTRAAPLFQQVIAVEASAQTFESLRHSTDMLKNVHIHHAAINDRTGDKLTFVNTYLSHASARLLLDGKAGTSDQTETVSTFKVDDLVPVGVPALIKMDVEGAEVNAIKGAQRTICDGSVLIYEDHGSDRACAPSELLLSMSEIEIYSIEDGFEKVATLDEIRETKTDSYKGYNFLAARKNSPLLASLVEHFANKQ